MVNPDLNGSEVDKNGPSLLRMVAFGVCVFVGSFSSSAAREFYGNGLRSVGIENSLGGSIEDKVSARGKAKMEELISQPAKPTFLSTPKDCSTVINKKMFEENGIVPEGGCIDGTDVLGMEVASSEK